MNWKVVDFGVLLILLILVGGSFSGAGFENDSLGEEEIGEIVEEVLEIIENESVEVEVNVSDDVGEVEVNLSEDNESVLGNVSNGSVGYVDIDDLVVEDDVVSGGDSEEEIEEEKISRSLVKDGQIEIEFEAFEDEGVEIEKKELLRGEFEKVVLNT